LLLRALLQFPLLLLAAVVLDTISMAQVEAVAVLGIKIITALLPEIHTL
jgi:hypothetical protein